MIKRFLSFLLIVSILTTCCVINSTFNIFAASTTTAYIEGVGVRVRTAPSTNSTIIEKVSNISATVLEKQDNSEGTWYKITYHNGSSQIEGFIFYDPSYIRIVTYNPDASFEEKLNAFPASYHDSLRALHAAYPNWDFQPEPVATSFWQAVADQSVNMRKQVQMYDDAISYRSMGPGAYDWSAGQWVSNNGGWTAASKEMIAYYMDPRNFLNPTEIYTFMQQSYNPAYQTEDGLRKIVAGTFLAGTYSDANDTSYGGSYVKVIMAAAQQSNVSPYIIASKIIQEQGSQGSSSLISGAYYGYEGLYNFFNVGATGATKELVITNGLDRARNEGWTTRSASIIGGAKFLAVNYISKGQDTYYYQDFNVHQPNALWHQYAQAVHDARNKGASLAKTYKDDSSFYISFKIPIFTDMPATPSPLPEKSTKKNNYYFSSISADGLTPTFDMFTYSYDLIANGDTTVYAIPLPGATYAGESSYNLTKGDNTVVLYVKSETGYLNGYSLNIDASQDCKLIINTGATTILGDTNGDGSISIADLANIRLKLLGLYNFNYYQTVAGDTNKDGKITIADLANIRLHLLGLYTIK